MGDERRSDHPRRALLGNRPPDKHERLTRVRDLVHNHHNLTGDRRWHRNPPDWMLELDLSIDAPADPHHAQFAPKSGGDDKGREDAGTRDPHDQLRTVTLKPLGQTLRERCDLVP